MIKIILNSKESASFSKRLRDEVLALMQSQGLGDVEFGIEHQPQESFDNLGPACFLTRELLLDNLAELQSDALVLEEQLSSFKERNDYLEEKVKWLRSKAGEGSFIPSKVKSSSNDSLNNSMLQSALVEVINKMESKVSEKVGLSFAKTKRVRKDKALISKSEYFDLKYVTNQLKQLGLQVREPLEFFVSYGAALELSPSEKFDTKSYLAMNPDVKESGINPLLHYIKHGKAEGRVLI
jgi:hypothetical protein